MEKFANVPSTGFGIANAEVSSAVVRVIQFEKGTVSFSRFSLMQLIAGVLLDRSFEEKDSVAYPVFKLIMELQRQFYSPPAFELIGTAAVDVNPMLEINRKDLLCLKNWLELRMHHCEKERDERSDRFNADTYIGQKLLLIDIREALLGTIEEV